MLATAVPLLFVLDPASHGVDAAIGQLDSVKRVDHLSHFGEHHRVDGGVGGGHVQGSELDALLPVGGSGAEPARHVVGVASGQDVDDLMVRNVRDGGGVVLSAPRESHEGRLVETNGTGAV